MRICQKQSQSTVAVGFANCDKRRATNISGLSVYTLFHVDMLQQ